MAGHQSLPGGLAHGRLPPQGCVIWLTGLPASGKSTLAREVKRLLAERGVHAVILDSDDMRRVLTPQARYTEEEREWFYAVIAHLAAWLARSGICVLVAATAHRRAYRERARQELADGAGFAEVYVRCPPAVCRQRDPKGIYAMAEQGDADSVPGLGATYEPPLDPASEVNTALTSPEEGAEVVVDALGAMLGLASKQAGSHGE